MDFLQSNQLVTTNLLVNGLHYKKMDKHNLVIESETFASLCKSDSSNKTYSSSCMLRVEIEGLRDKAS